MIPFSLVTSVENVGAAQTHLFSDLLQAMQITWQSLSVSHPFGIHVIYLAGIPTASNASVKHIARAMQL